MSVWQALAIVAAGLMAGMINTVVGSGTLITFPVLLAFGYPPVTANVSNTIGLVPGSLTGAIGYRRELAGQRERVLRLGSASLAGGICGAVLLLTLPPGAFAAIVPALIGIALVLVIVQPWLAGKLRDRQLKPGQHGGALLWLGIFATGVYGGYFGAAQGVLLLGLMGILMAEPLQRVNGVKNVLAMVVNAVAGVFFAFAAHVDWLAALLIAVGAVLGGVLGAKVGRKLPPVALRAVIVVVGVAAIVKLLAFS
ncbi:MAG: sulfite exporter TauE/SafE family protein [Sciscionella sp.]|nr:sulfite exporter TauE/SafE family protein [Sciscionella sp.]